MARWNAHFPIKDLFTDEDVGPEEAQRIGKEVARRMRARPHVFGDETFDFVDRFEDVENQEDFNDILDELYDVADSIRVWIQ